MRRLLRDSAVRIKSTTVEIEAQRRTYVFEIAQMRTAADTEVPALVDALARLPGVAVVSWRTMT